MNNRETQTRLNLQRYDLPGYVPSTTDANGNPLPDAGGVVRLQVDFDALMDSNGFKAKLLAMLASEGYSITPGGGGTGPVTPPAATTRVPVLFGASANGMDTSTNTLIYTPNSNGFDWAPSGFRLPVGAVGDIDFEVPVAGAGYLMLSPRAGTEGLGADDLYAVWQNDQTLRPQARRGFSWFNGAEATPGPAVRIGLSVTADSIIGRYSLDTRANWQTMVGNQEVVSVWPRPAGQVLYVKHFADFASTTQNITASSTFVTA